jgi:SOS-response transcriptional repressor LexA
MRDLGIMDGDIVLARQTESPSVGDIVVALVDGETTVKSLYIRDGKVELRPANPDFKPQFYDSDKVFVQGVVFALHRNY